MKQGAAGQSERALQVGFDGGGGSLHKQKQNKFLGVRWTSDRVCKVCVTLCVCRESACLSVFFQDLHYLPPLPHVQPHPVGFC